MLEAAIVMPFFLLMLVGILEFGRAVMVLHSLEEAARVGARAAIVEGATASDVTQAVSATMATCGINDYELTVVPDPSVATQWEPITVTITADYNDVNWLPVPMYLGQTELSGSSSLPREAEND